MSRKRVHEIAKAQQISSKQLLALLQAAGVEVKAAASSVDEGLALAAIKRAAGADGKTGATDQSSPAASGAKAASTARNADAASVEAPRHRADAPAPTGQPSARAGGTGSPSQAGATASASAAQPQRPKPADGLAPRAADPHPHTNAAPPRSAPPQGQTAATGQRSVAPSAPQPAGPRDAAASGKAAPPVANAAAGAAAQGAGEAQAGEAQASATQTNGGTPHQGAPHVRPTRDSRTGERTPGADAAGRSGRRRVVIDSQASRRTGGPPPSQPPRRPPRRGRRRRGLEEQPLAPLDASAMQATDVIKVTSGATVKDAAEYLGVPVPEVIKKLMSLGEMATLTQTLSDEAIAVLAEEFGKKIEVLHAADEQPQELAFDDAEEDLAERPPVVTIMGHVDHGKTSLLDAIRQTEVAAGEAGGITQHIGAYQVKHADKEITFLDTPGHEAFTAMRARGARVTDVAVIVVAADDGVKPQTEEAIDHAKAADVPIVVAINKVDKEGARPDRVRTEMAARGLQPAAWGGETEFVEVSAKTGQGLSDLLDTIQVVADLEELKANPDAQASGTVIESKLDPGRGPVVSILIERGTLAVGDALVAGAHYGRVRAMQDFIGARIKRARPGQPVEVLGFDGVPEAGELVRAVENERRARQLAAERSTRLKSEALARRSGRKVSLEDVFKLAQEGAVKELSLVVKADVAGSLEAIEDEIAKLPQEEVSVNIVHRGVGGINESDVMLAVASGGLILAFNVRPVGDARRLAEREGVEIRSYAVIYRAIEELRAAMQGMLEPEEVEAPLGQAEVRQLFRASRVGVIAGCQVSDGRIVRGARTRVVRDGTVVYDTTIGSLKRFNEDAREVSSGYECGIVLVGFQDLKEGDVLEVYEMNLRARELV